MEIEVIRSFHGYSFTVAKDKDYENVDNVIDVCLQLERQLAVTNEVENEDEEGE